MNKTLLTSLLLLFITQSAVGQDKTVMAKSEYMSAESAYGSGDYEKCLKHLVNAQEMVGNNRLIQYLRVKSYYNLKEYPRAKEELTLFFDITDKKHSDTEEYEEMVGMIAPVNEAVDRQASIGGVAYGKIKDNLDQAVEFLSQGNTKEANRSVFKAFKVYEDQLQNKVSIEQLKIVFDNELKELINIADLNPKIYYNEELYTFYSEVIGVGNKTWMGEEIIVNTALLEGDFKTVQDNLVIINDFNDEELPRSYFILNSIESNENFNICPQGWRVPLEDDWTLLVDSSWNDYKNCCTSGSTKKMEFGGILVYNGFGSGIVNYYYQVHQDKFVRTINEDKVKTSVRKFPLVGFKNLVFTNGYVDIQIYRSDTKENRGFNLTTYRFPEKFRYMDIPQGFCRCIKE